MPNRLALPGFLGGWRYQAASEEGARYLALYELESVGVLQQADYVRVATERSERERKMLASIPMIDRRVFRLILDGDAWTDAAPYQLTVAMSPAPGGDEDFVAWYHEEHIRMLLDVPGWRRVRLFQQVEGDGPRSWPCTSSNHQRCSTTTTTTNRSARPGEPASATASAATSGTSSSCCGVFSLGAIPPGEISAQMSGRGTG